MKVVLRNPKREMEVAGATTVNALLVELSIIPESVIVICNDELVTHDTHLGDDDTVEIRSVTSGGA